MVRHAHPVGGDLRGEWFIRGTEPDDGLPTPAKAPARIAYPPVGAVFAIDPDIPLERQRIIFAASGVDDAATWVLDGEALAAGAHVRWSPAAGRHTVALYDSTGHLLDTIVFLVRGQPE
jgi:penicillin-binding protein 1C